MESPPSPSLFSALLADLTWVVRAVQSVLGNVHLSGRLETAQAHGAHRRFTMGLRRIEALFARYLAGRLVRRAGRVRPEGAEVQQGLKPSPVARVVLPRRFGWLVALGGYHAAGHGSQLRTLLERPEMAGFLEAVPQAGLALRPLCRALGIEASVYRPGFVPKVRVPRVRKARVKPAPVDFGRIPLPRGVLAAAKRAGFGKRV